MKSLWNIISVIALANLLAIGGFVGWLRATDRISMERVRDLRVTLSETISAKKARENDDASKADAAQKAADEEAKKARPPISAMEQLSLRLETTEVERQRNERFRQEIEALRQGLLKERAELDAERHAFDTAKTEFEQMRERIVAQEGAEQFKKTLNVLQSLKPEEVKSTLVQIMDTAKGPAGKDTALSYLNAMPDRVRSKVMSEFIRQDPKLAADLLEGLRVRGINPPPPEVAPG